jgi:predicted nucleic acid-binding protein
MGIEYIWDTNIVIYYLQQQFPPSAEKFIDDILKQTRPAISAITEIELLCWKTATEKDLEVLHNFIDDVLVIELEQSIKMKTAEIRKKHNVKLPVL